MSSTATMDLSILKLNSPRKRLVHSARFSFDTDYVHSYLLTSNSDSPRGGSPPSSLSCSSTDRALDDEDDESFTIFEQYRAAIPFKWEETPGTCKDTAKTGEKREDSLKCISESETEDYFGSNSSAISRSSSSGTRSSIVHEQDLVIGGASSPVLSGLESLQINLPVFSAVENYVKDNDNEHSLEIYSVGQSGPALKPPPGKNSIRQLLTLEGDERSITSTISKSRRHSFRRDGLKALTFLTTSNNKRAFNEQISGTLLGLEDWPKVVQEQEKQEAREKLAQVKQETQEKQADNENAERQIQVSSSSRFSFSFRKKPVKDHRQPNATGSNIDELLGRDDDIFNEDFGIKGGLMERRPLQCMSSRGLADGYSKPKSWAYDSDNDYSDNETDAKNDYFDPFEDIAEEEPKNFPPSNENDSPTKISKPKQKKHRRGNAIGRVFGASSIANTEKEKSSDKAGSRPSRLSAVSPAPPLNAVIATPGRSNPKQSKVTVSHHTPGSGGPSPATITKNPLLKLCLSTAIGQALFRNVKHFRSFEFHTPRTLTAK